MKVTRRDLIKGVLGLLGLGVGKAVADRLPSAPAEPLTKPDLAIETLPSNHNPGECYGTGIVSPVFYQRVASVPKKSGLFTSSQKGHE